MATFTTNQILHALANANGHNHRLVILRCATQAQLKAIAKREQLCNFSGYWNCEDLVVRILEHIESRYATIDEGKNIHVPGIFGLPQDINSFLIEDRKQKLMQNQIHESDYVPDDAFSKTIHRIQQKQIETKKQINSAKFIHKEDIFTLALRIRDVSVVDDKNCYTSDSLEKIDAIQHEFEKNIF